MKKKFLSVICLILSLVFACFTFTACGKDNGSNNRDLSNLDITFDDNGDPVFKDMTLQVWSVIGEPDNQYLDKVVDMFNTYYKNNGVQVKVVSQNESNFYIALPNVIRSDKANAPDMIIYHSERLTQFASSGIVLPMEEYLEAGHANFDASNYLPNVMSECYYKNKVYGIPLDTHAGVWYYRSDMLEKNGLTKPTTLQELIDVCNALIDLNNEGHLWYRVLDTDKTKCNWKRGTLPDFYPLSMSADNGIEQGWIPESALIQNGGKMTLSNGRPGWNDDNLAKIMQIIKDWRTGENHYPDEYTYSGKFIGQDMEVTALWSNLGKGTSVFGVEGPWFIEQQMNNFEALLGDLPDQDGKTYQPLDIMSMEGLFALDPTSENAKKQYGVGHTFSICSSIHSPERAVAAALFAKYVTENAYDYTQGGHLPACNSVLNSDQFLTKPYYEKYVKKIGSPENFVFLGNTEFFSEVYEGLKFAYSDLFSNQASIIQKTAQEILTLRYNEAITAIESAEDL